MALTYDSLMAYKIPEVSQRLTSRDAVFYALSVGFGQDPLDLRQLDFVDAHRRLRAVPTQSVVLGHPGFWMADPKTGIDPVRVVHGEQRIVMHCSLPVEGGVIGRTRVTGLIDKAAARGALMHSQRDVLDAETGELLATTRSTTFLRGDGGFGVPDSPVELPHALPDTPPDFVVEMPTRPEQPLYYRLNGDDNPLHADPAVAAKAGFPRPILHGLCTLGVVGHAAADARRLRRRAFQGARHAVLIAHLSRRNDRSRSGRTVRSAARGRARGRRRQQRLGRLRGACARVRR